MKPILQVALDFVELIRALNLAEEAVNGGADWLEAGTPLIWHVLMSSRVIKKRHLRFIAKSPSLISHTKTSVSA